MNTEIINVAYAEDHATLRKSVIGMVQSEHIKFTLEAENGLDMMRQLNEAAILPDICIVDIQMPGMDGFALVKMIKQDYPTIKILVLTGYAHQANIIRMVNTGINGYLSKNSNPKEIAQALQEIQASGYYYSELANQKIFLRFQNADIKAANIPDREMEFLKHCCSDLSYDQIAKEMGISTSTVETYRKRLFERLGLDSRMGLIVFAMQSGIVTPDLIPTNFKI